MAIAAQTLALISAGAYDNAPVSVAGFDPLSLSGTVNGVFLSANVAAEVSTGIIGGERVLVLAFRGSDDRVDWLNDLRGINADYATFAPLISAVDAYAKAHFMTVVATGHSLGGAMVQVFMDQHPAGGAVTYEGVSFASPGALIYPGDDARVTNYAVVDDPLVFLGTHRYDVGKLAKSNDLVANALAQQLASSTPLSVQDVLDSIPYLAADYVNRGETVVLNPGGRDPLTLQTILKGDPKEHAIELYQALVPGAVDPANQITAPTSSATAKTTVDTAVRGVLREVVSAVEVNADAARIDKGLSQSTFVSELVDQAQRSTAPALVVAAFIEGVTPTSARLDGLASFAGNQYDAYLKLGVQDARLGPYEALGLGFASTSEFQAKYGSGSDSVYVAAAYNGAFGRAASGVQIEHFLAQDSYLEKLYLDAGISAGDAALRARGAVVGQMLGVAAQESGNAYITAANAFLVDASDGSVTYGAKLIGVSASADMGLVA